MPSVSSVKHRAHAKLIRPIYATEMMCSSYSLRKIWSGFKSSLAKSIFSHLNFPAGKWGLVSSSYTLTSQSTTVINALYTSSRQHGGALLHTSEGSGNLLKSED